MLSPSAFFGTFLPKNVTTRKDNAQMNKSISLNIVKVVRSASSPTSIVYDDRGVNVIEISLQYSIELCGNKETATFTDVPTLKGTKNSLNDTRLYNPGTPGTQTASTSQ